MSSELYNAFTESGPRDRKSGLGSALAICIAGVCWLSLSAPAALSPPLAEDGSRGGLGTITSWSFASNNAGRITLPGTVLDRFDQTGTPFFSTSFFRGNLYHADAACTLLGHEFYLERNTPVEVTFSVYEGATSAGPFIRVDEATVLAPSGYGYVASGQRGVTLRAGYTYAVGAAATVKNAAGEA
ncbi:MAG TPA: hypothetical protein PL176_11120, partial [Kiritimatiellia bacterium]|nr:hypothetical protein [Kiritimatiellia bacterium]